MDDVEQPDKPTVVFNPACSKCRTVASLMEERGIDAEYVRYLDEPPSINELRRLMNLLGIDDPADMMRRHEAPWADLGLDEASSDDRLRAIVAHPILLERPIVVLGDRAVIARPADKVLDLLDS